MIDVVAVVGPTAVGKSAVADGLAAAIGTSVISADSMQVYRGMDIGTAKMSPGECHAPLLMVDVADPGTAYSAALFQRDARAAIDKINASGHPAVLCGGTGLYVRAVIDEFDFPSGELESISRSRYEELLERIGADALHALLSERDPASAEAIHPHNTRRVVRALEMSDEGVSYAEQRAGFSENRAHYCSSQYGLTCDRAVLYERINKRVDLMMEMGLIDEVKGLVEQGLSFALTSRQAIGYKEIIDYLEGTLSLSEAVDLIKMRSRRYAKRQLSWFKRDSRIFWIDMDETGVDGAIELIREREGL
ncbi:tRNA (adenosine(37)-N6)-dimethylallyltransferase MiaA [Collinsella sp. An307]|uniref:tRNA (adenosine(37)-N6)-dimethylallyltransferase MiaA n=1 Tax=Collinsella sp. An307 TaxID=1965630 RepID=UPI000B38C6C4|nr:tRNA (adenosine(37)-N6)-dimethylallyltransferase MiaA [Collinsella sp. An307]OUO19768.1 tRNA (adenosine(37)-N6)-dimethylallyltransferase MiaA [Collinsella sp. An307]